MTSTRAEAGVDDTVGVSPTAFAANDATQDASKAAESRSEPTPLAPGARTALVVLSAVGVVLIIASIVLAFVVKQHSDARRNLDIARSDAVAAARQAIINLDSISAATIDADLKRVLAGTTGSFKDQFSKSQTDLKQVVVQAKRSSTGTIRSAGVVRADTDSATVLVAVDRIVKDSTNQNGVVINDRWKLDLEKHGGRWLVAALLPVG
ncbi:MAG: hypothetical protein JWM02_615 [Frankiales bacterium]|nr:hypothetical protein [Frankiales bacterium]